MDDLSLSLKKEALSELLRAFHTLTGIKIAIFDTSGNEILSYPTKHCAFCAAIRSLPLGNHLCEQSNHASFKRCQVTKELELFTCHAGLIEATAPLFDNNTLLGYIMFGQITDNPDSSSVRQMLHEALLRVRETNTTDDIASTQYEILHKSTEQIHAAAQICEACTFYVLLKDMISFQRENFIENLNAFLMSHLSEDLSVPRLMQEFRISKNKLYDACGKYLTTGIAEHIKQLRISEAKRLLTTTTLSINEISDRVGFADYNYFCRVFKKEVGMSAGNYRKNN